MTDPSSFDELERRQAARYSIKMPIKFRRGKGMTRNISAQGVCFQTDAGLDLGEVLEFSLVFGSSFARRSNIGVRCEGRVVWTRRSEETEAGYEVGAKFTEVLFEAQSLIRQLSQAMTATQV